MKVFVAGGTGVLGSRVVPRLVAAGHTVTVVARNAEKADLVRSMGATAVAVSIFDANALAEAMGGHDAVVNLATHIPGGASAARPSGWDENDRIRRDGSAALVDAALAAGIGRFVQESIAFVYTDGGDRWLDEDTPIDGSAPAAAAVVAAEANASRITEAGGAGVVLRFGFFQSADSELTDLSFKTSRFGFATVFGPPEAYYPIVHTDDAADAVVVALTAPAGRYNVVGDEPPTRAEYAAALQQALGDPGRVRVGPKIVSRQVAKSTANLIWSHRVTNERFRVATGWAPRFPAATDALAEVVAASREPRRVRSILAAILLALLGLASLLLGAYAVLAPHGFYEAFPAGRAWVAADGPFNEHLIRDFGALNLALAAVQLAAAATMTITLVRTAAIATLLFGVPHLAYHLAHLSMYEGLDQVGNVVSLSSPVIAAVVLLALARTRARRSGLRV